MAERFKMADIIAAALAGTPQEQAERPSTPPPQPEAPQRPASERRRPIGQTHTREVHAGIVVGSRQAQRDARAYAELWWQALREWHTFKGEEVVFSSGPSRTSRMQVVGIGNWAGGVGQYGSYKGAEDMLSTPIGALTVTRVALAITDQASPLLERLRSGKGPDSLIHSNGRGWNGENAPAYAAAVLALAMALGDTQAVFYHSDL